jgi:hypothetical protein
MGWRRGGTVAMLVVPLLLVACSGPSLAADQAAVNQAQHEVNVDRAKLDTIQGRKLVVICVAGHCPPTTPETAQQRQQVTEAHQRLVDALLRLETAKAHLLENQNG